MTCFLVFVVSYGNIIEYMIYIKSKTQWINKNSIVYIKIDVYTSDDIFYNKFLSSISFNLNVYIITCDLT